VTVPDLDAPLPPPPPAPEKAPRRRHAPKAASVGPVPSPLEMILREGPVFNSQRQTAPLRGREITVVDPTPREIGFDWLFICLDPATARRAKVLIRGCELEDVGRSRFDGAEFLSVPGQRPKRLLPIPEDMRAVQGIEVILYDTTPERLPDGLVSQVSFNYVNPVFLGRRAEVEDEHA